jgi:hypothetical protein
MTEDRDSTSSTPIRKRVEVVKKFSAALKLGKPVHKAGYCLGKPLQRPSSGVSMTGFSVLCSNSPLLFIPSQL